MQRAVEVAGGAKEGEPAKKALERVGKEMDGLGPDGNLERSVGMAGQQGRELFSGMKAEIDAGEYCPCR